MKSVHNSIPVLVLSIRCSFYSGKLSHSFQFVITISYKLLIIMVKKENKILICRVAGGKHITPTLRVFLLALKAFSSFLKDHVFFSTQGWCTMQDNSMVHPTPVTATHRCILPRPMATWPLGFHGAGPTQQLVWVHITPRFGCQHVRETLPHGTYDPWLQHSDTHTQTFTKQKSHWGYDLDPTELMTLLWQTWEQLRQSIISLTA